MSESFFEPLDNCKPYAKVAIEGFSKSGKTFTAAQIVIGLYRLLVHLGLIPAPVEKAPGEWAGLPVVLFDTEEAAQFLIPLFRKSGVPVVRKRSRSLADLKETMKRVREGQGAALLIDSITHIWTGFVETYQQKKNRKRIEFREWAEIKSIWQAEFSTPYVYDLAHYVMTGRAGYEYESERNEETGKREIYKSGVKMKAEGELAYEADLLILMERVEEVLTDPPSILRRAIILGDRSGMIDGKVIKNPQWRDFSPAIEAALAEAKPPRIRGEQDAGVLIDDEDDRSGRRKAKEIALEEIEGALKLVWPGQSAEEKKLKAEAIFAAFQTASWAKVTTLAPEQLAVGLEVVQRFIAEKTGKRLTLGTQASIPVGVRLRDGELESASFLTGAQVGIKPGESPFGDIDPREAQASAAANAPSVLPGILASQENKAGASSRGLPGAPAVALPSQPPQVSAATPGGAPRGDSPPGMGVNPGGSAPQGVENAPPGLAVPPGQESGAATGNGAEPTSSKPSPSGPGVNGSSSGPANTGAAMGSETSTSAPQGSRCPKTPSGKHWWDAERQRCQGCGVTFPGLSSGAVELGKLASHIANVGPEGSLEKPAFVRPIQPPPGAICIFCKKTRVTVALVEKLPEGAPRRFAHKGCVSGEPYEVLR